MTCPAQAALEAGLSRTSCPVISEAERRVRETLRRFHEPHYPQVHFGTNGFGRRVDFYLPLRGAVLEIGADEPQTFARLREAGFRVAHISNDHATSLGTEALWALIELLAGQLREGFGPGKLVRSHGFGRKALLKCLQDKPEMPHDVGRFDGARRG